MGEEEKKRRREEEKKRRREEEKKRRNLPASFIQFLPVIIGSGVCSAFILGVHADHGRVFANKCFGVQTLLQGLLSQLGLLPLLQVQFLCEFSLFIIIFVCFKLDNYIEDLCCLCFQLIRVHGFKLQWFYSDREGDLLFLLKLLL